MSRHSFRADRANKQDMTGLYDNLTIYDLTKGFELPAIKRDIDTKRPFGIRFYYFDDLVLDTVKVIIDSIFASFHKPQLSDLLYNGIKEVIINGLKANIKRIVFLDYGLDLDSESETEEGMKLFKDYILSRSPKEIEEELIQKNYMLMIYFFLEEHGMRIEVMNNCVLSEIEERRIREKFRNALKYRNIMEFMNEHGDSLEGAGLGLFLLVLMLRQMNVDPNYFRVGKSDEGFTVSRIEIPFSDEYSGIRGKNT